MRQTRAGKTRHAAHGQRTPRSPPYPLTTVYEIAITPLTTAGWHHRTENQRHATTPQPLHITIQCGACRRARCKELQWWRIRQSRGHGKWDPAQRAARPYAVARTCALWCVTTATLSTAAAIIASHRAAYIVPFTIPRVPPPLLVGVRTAACPRTDMSRGARPLQPQPPVDCTLLRDDAPHL